MAWSADRVTEVLDAYHELTRRAPRELTAAAVVMSAPPAPFVPDEWRGRPVVAVLACHSGPSPQGDLAPLRALDDPIFDVIAERPYVEQQSLLDAGEPNGLHYYWKTEFVSQLSEEFLRAFAAHALRMTSPLSNSVIFHIGGALNERGDDDGSVGNRDARYVTGFSGQWAPDAPPDEHVEWVRDAWTAIRPFSTGGNYVNFQLADDTSDRTIEGYRASYTRLQQAKALYDPGNLFRVNRNISPAA
jgi:hypothetical protein